MIDEFTRTKLSTLERPRFAPGLLLEADDLTSAVDYTRDLVRLVLRSLFGCGVICGLTVTEPTDYTKPVIKVSKGLALDHSGNLIEVREPETFTISCLATGITTLWLVVYHIEKACNPRDGACIDDDLVQTVNTRIRDGYALQLIAENDLPEGACTNTSNLDVTDQTILATLANDANKDHHAGACPEPCDCDGHTGCECNYVVLAKISIPDEKTDSTVRRAVRPVLTRYLDALQKAPT